MTTKKLVATATLTYTDVTDKEAGHLIDNVHRLFERAFSEGLLSQGSEVGGCDTYETYCEFVPVDSPAIFSRTVKRSHLLQAGDNAATCMGDIFFDPMPSCDEYHICTNIAAIAAANAIEAVLAEFGITVEVDVEDPPISSEGEDDEDPADDEDDEDEE